MQELRKRGFVAMGGTPRELADWLTVQAGIWGPVLQAAGINSFQALASGMSPLRVATMEGAQAFGAFAQGGLGVSGVLSKLISPIGLTVTAAAARPVRAAATSRPSSGGRRNRRSPRPTSVTWQSRSRPTP